MSSQEGSQKPTRKSGRYQRVPEGDLEHSLERPSMKDGINIIPSTIITTKMNQLRSDNNANDADEDGEDHQHHETSSLVVETVDEVFRRKSTFEDDTGDLDIHPVRSTASIGSNCSRRTASSAGGGEDGSPVLHNIMISRSMRSHGTSSIGDLDWDEEEDEAGLRRYHLDFETRTNIPLPAEFSRQSLPRRIWQAFLNLQAAARQRRAARLLTMPSQSWEYQLHSCFLTWCCDATDRGILLVLLWLTAGILIGVIGRKKSGWWWTLFILFIIRISFRRTVDYIQGRRRMKQQRQRVPSTAESELGGAGGQAAFWSAKKLSDRSFREVV